MTTLTAGLPLDIRTINPAGLGQVEGGQVLSFSDTQVVIQTFDQFNNPLISTYDGTGFGEPSGTGFPTTGEITSYTLEVYGTLVFSLSGPAVTVEATNAAAAGGVDSYDQFLFGGDDTMTGADNSAAGDYLIGFSGDDIINGLAGADHLFGGDGKDRIIGGAGNDVLAGSLYTADATVNGVSGSRFDDGVRDNLSGGDGDDHVTVGLLDSASGGAGADTLDVTLVGLSHGVNLDLTGQDRWSVLAAATGGHFSSFEVLGALYATQFDDVISVSGATSVYGYGGVDHINGGAGAQLIDGGSGDDVIQGGAGADLVIGGAGADYLDGGEGMDTVSYAGSAGGVSLVLSDGGGQVVGQGSGAAAEGDSLFGFERYVGSDHNDVMTASGPWSASLSQITLDGGAGDDRLTGGSNADILMGGAGNDTLIGGGGGDRLYGGEGADHFVFQAVSDSTPTARDVIYDFNAGEGDVIDLRAIDARPLVDGNQAFVMVGAFDGHAGEARVTYSYSPTGDRTTLALDVDGDKHTDFSLSIVGDVTTGWLL